MSRPWDNHFLCLEYNLYTDRPVFAGAVFAFQMQFPLRLPAIGMALFFKFMRIGAIIVKGFRGVGECGYSFDPDTVDPDDFDVDIYEIDSLRELAKQFVDEGLFGEIPENVQSYLDYDTIARDLAADYSETTIAGARLIYRCG